MQSFFVAAARSRTQAVGRRRCERFAKRQDVDLESALQRRQKLALDEVARDIDAPSAICIVNRHASRVVDQDRNDDVAAIHRALVDDGTHQDQHQ